MPKKLINDAFAAFKQQPCDIKTREKFRTLNVDKFDNKRVFLSANAGAGKTREIIHFLQNHSNYSICLVSFTNSVVADIKKKLKEVHWKNVDVRTYDSLCKENGDTLLKENGDTLLGRGIDYEGFYSKKRAATILRNCTDEKITYENFNDLQWKIIRNHLDDLYKYCKRKNVRNGIVNKLLMFYKYVCKDYDIFIVDEAQDLETTKSKFFDTINKKATIFVGDPKQALYVENTIFDSIYDDEDVSLTLTHTFRYGSELIDLINSGPCDTHTAYSNKETNIYIGRTIDECIDKIDVILITAWKHVLAYAHLIKENKIFLSKKAIKGIRENIDNHKKYLVWKKIWLDTRREHSLTRDDFFELKKKEHLLEYDTNKWEEIETILANLNPKKRSIHQALITTVFQAKGIEFSRVYIDDDCFPEGNTNPGSFRRKDNIFYTAITRCRKYLYMSHRYSPFTLTEIDRELERITNHNGKLSIDEFEDFIRKTKILKKCPRSTKRLKYKYVKQPRFVLDEDTPSNSSFYE